MTEPKLIKANGKLNISSAKHIRLLISKLLEDMIINGNHISNGTTIIGLLKLALQAIEQEQNDILAAQVSQLESQLQTK